MSFLQWTFLFGAFAIVGPLAAHLLAKPRFRRVGFTMLRFLRSGQRESHSRRKLRDLFVLLLRCAAILLVAMLFAQPVLHVEPEPQKQRRIHYLALDDSMSMAYRDTDESLFARMVETTLERVRRASEDARFHVCALASGRSAGDLDKSQAMAEIRRLAVVPRSAQLGDFFSALRQGRRAAATGDVISALVVSDFSPQVLAEFERIRDPAVVDDVQYELVAPSEPVNNAAVVGARLIDATENHLSLDVTVANYGPAAHRRKLTARTPEANPVSMELDLAPQRSTVFPVQMDLGLRPGGADQPYVPIEVTLAPEDNLADDDVYRLAAYLRPAASSNVLLVHRGQETFLFETALGALSRGHGRTRLNLRKVAADRLASTDLNWAQVVVFASWPSGISGNRNGLESVLSRGGRLIFFAAQGPAGDVTSRLWRDGLLPVLPDQWHDGTAYLRLGPSTGAALGLDDRAARSLCNYRLDRIAMNGYCLCDVSPQAECLWRFADGAGFLYGQSQGRGLSLFVNTSIDDSLGLLAKSRAWVAFCQYVLGHADRVQPFCFCTTDRPIVHLPESMGRPRERNTTLLVENCDGRRIPVRVDGTTLRLPTPSGTGWIKTVGQPVLYAAVNMPAGETDVSPPAAEAVADAVKRVFVTDPKQGPPVMRARSDMQRKPIWKAVAWVAIVLLLSESTLANRLRR